MAYQAVFKRYELKFMITLEQKQRLLEVMAPHMALDKYGRDTIRNIYFDTPTYQLIRRSIEKPLYKEKLRIRCYRDVTASSPVFVETTTLRLPSFIKAMQSVYPLAVTRFSICASCSVQAART